VTTADEAERACTGGAAYLVTPTTDLEVIAATTSKGVPIVPGGLTPTELHAGWRAGASAVKVFPAGAVGPGYVKDLHGPFPDLRVIPSGGVDLAAARAWLRAGADAVSVGGPLLGDAFRGGDLGELEARAREFVAACSGTEEA
jgi:2-dehydro-3-deoxyphosphogluconate aldolase/(4S)-4-hydroxy-2-oxoglutarate aldolase